MQNQEHVDAKEQANTIELVRLNVESADPKPGEAKRGQHAKHHGCVKATFTIADDIPDDLRRGIFSKQQSFDALIRFSNGRKSDDREPDAHGMAIKLLNVPGSKLLEGRETETPTISCWLIMRCSSPGTVQNTWISTEKLLKLGAVNFMAFFFWEK